MLRQLFREIAIYGTGDLIFNLIKFAVLPIYAHLFTVEEFGVISLVTVFSGLIGFLLNMGMDNAVQRYYWDSKECGKGRAILVSTGLWVLLIWSIFFTATMIFILYPFGNKIELRYHVLWSFIFLSLASNVPTQILQYSQNVLRLHFSPWKFTLVSGWKNLSGILLGLLLIIVFKQGLFGFFWGHFGALMLSFPLGVWLIRKELKFHFDKEIAKKLVLFGYPYIFANLGYWIFGSLDRWMLSELSDNTEVGLYSIAFRFATIIIFINTAFGQAWAPSAMKMYADRADYREIFSRVLSYLFFGLTVIGVIISLFGLEILKLTTPPSYWPASTILSIIGMGMVVSGTQQITALGIFFAKKTYLIPFAAWITALFNFILNWILIPKVGALGAAITTLLSYGGLSGIYLYWSQKFHPIPLGIKPLCISLSILLVTLLFSFYLNRLEWNVLLLVSKAIFCGLVIGSGFLFDLLKGSDLKMIIQWKKECQ